MEITPETRHKRLIKAIKENNDIIDLRPNIRISTSSGDLTNLDTNEVNDTANLIVTYLNLTGGSGENFDLYELLQSYFGDEEGRKEINECVERSLKRLRDK